MKKQFYVFAETRETTRQENGHIRSVWSIDLIFDNFTDAFAKYLSLIKINQFVSLKEIIHETNYAIHNPAGNGVFTLLADSEEKENAAENMIKLFDLKADKVYINNPKVYINNSGTKVLAMFVDGKESIHEDITSGKYK